MKATDYGRRLFRRWRSEYRYHTVGSQTLALCQQIAICIFLWSEWQDNAIALGLWAVASIIFCMFIQSQMLTERPSRRGLRRVIRELEIVASVGTALLIIFLSGSVRNLLVVFIVYVVGASLTFELHGPKRRWLQLD
jgi:hypothetical protein